MGTNLGDLLDRIAEWNMRVKQDYVDLPDSVPFGGNEIALILTDIHRALWVLADRTGGE